MNVTRFFCIGLLYTTMVFGADQNGIDACVKNRKSTQRHVHWEPSSEKDKQFLVRMSGRTLDAPTVFKIQHFLTEPERPDEPLGCSFEYNVRDHSSNQDCDGTSKGILILMHVPKTGNLSKDSQKRLLDHSTRLWCAARDNAAVAAAEQKHSDQSRAERQVRFVESWVKQGRLIKRSEPKTVDPNKVSTRWGGFAHRNERMTPSREKLSKKKQLPIGGRPVYRHEQHEFIIGSRWGGYQKRKWECRN